LSSELIEAATNSMWPSSSVAMLDQSIVLAQLVAAAEVERLVHVVHERRHLAEAPAEQFLDRRSGVRIGLGGCRHLDL
jgi:hypothetical protein